MVKHLGVGKQNVSDFITNGQNQDEAELEKLDIDLLTPGQYQPRKIISEEALAELAESIKVQGIIQPVVVRQIGENEYEILAGERRWRAAKLAGLFEIQCLVRNVPDEAAIAMALIENIQREDLNVIEEAQALKRLMNEFDLTHEQTAEAVGKKRTTVTNLLRLLKLDDSILEMVMTDDLEAGAARALIGLEKEEAFSLAKKASNGSLTVRQVESLVLKLKNTPETKQEKVKVNSAVVSRLIAGFADMGVSLTVERKRGGRHQFGFEKTEDELEFFAKSIEEINQHRKNPHK